MDASSRNNTGKRGVTGSAYASACSQELAEVGTTSCHDFGSNDPWKAEETSPLRSNSFKDPQFRCAGAPFVPPESRMSSGGVSPGIVTLNAAMSACELDGSVAEGRGCLVSSSRVPRTHRSLRGPFSEGATACRSILLPKNHKWGPEPQVVLGTSGVSGCPKIPHPKM